MYKLIHFRHAAQMSCGTDYVPSVHSILKRSAINAGGILIEDIGRTASAHDWVT